MPAEMDITCRQDKSLKKTESTLEKAMECLVLTAIRTAQRVPCCYLGVTRHRGMRCSVRSFLLVVK